MSLFLCRKLYLSLGSIFFILLMTACSEPDYMPKNNYENSAKSSKSNASQIGEIIPMTDDVYQGKYLLRSNEKKGKLNLVIYESIFPEETVFSKMEINCSNKKYRKLGEGINNIKDIELYSDNQKWIEPIDGGTHEDVINFVCKK